MIKIINKWFIISVTLCNLAVGFSSFVEDGECDDGDDGGIEESGPDRKIWVPIYYSITCTDVTTNITATQTSSGKFKVTADFGSIGIFEEELNLSGRTGDFTISNVTVTFPKQPDGEPQQFEEVACAWGGNQRCIPVEACLTMASAQILGLL